MVATTTIFFLFLTAVGAITVVALCANDQNTHTRAHIVLQVNNLREIQALRRLSPNPHVITLEEVLYDQPTGRLALVFELMDANLYELIRGRRHYLNGQVRKGG